MLHIFLYMNAALLNAKHDQGNIIIQTYNYTRKC